MILRTSGFALLLFSLLSLTHLSSYAASDFPSFFIRYQYSAGDILKLLKKNEGKPLDPSSTAARWLDEMGWRKWVRDYSNKPFHLESEIISQLKAQEQFLKD